MKNEGVIRETHRCLYYICQTLNAIYPIGQTYSFYAEMIRAKGSKIYFFFFYKKPTAWRVGSTFLENSRFQAQNFLNFVQISGVTFLTFSHYKPKNFLRYQKFQPNPVTPKEMSLFWLKNYENCTFKVNLGNFFLTFLLGIFN